MNSDGNNKDFIDKIFEYCEKYKTQGVRSFTVLGCFVLFFALGIFWAPSFIKILSAGLPFKIDFLILSPLDIIFDYIKIAFFFSLFMTLPYLLYQFGKLRFEHNNFEDKTEHIFNAAFLFLIFLVGNILTYKVTFPFLIMFLYGLNFGVASYATSLSSIISTYIYLLILTIALMVLPCMKYLIKKSRFFNYDELVKNKKTVMIYAAVLTMIIAIPVDFVAIAIIFLTFFLLYRQIMNYAKTRD